MERIEDPDVEAGAVPGIGVDVDEPTGEAEERELDLESALVDEPDGGEAGEGS
jgi:hypothetical protein